MANLLLYLVVQLNLGFGLAGLIWPEKFAPLFGVLMFPWPATERMIRLNGVIAIAAYLLLLAKLFLFSH